MKPKITEIDKLKYWLDAELTILHIMFAITVWLLTHGRLTHILLSIYIIIQVIYLISRGLYLSSLDKDYLRIPK